MNDDTVTVTIAREDLTEVLIALRCEILTRLVRRDVGSDSASLQRVADLLTAQRDSSDVDQDEL